MDVATLRRAMHETSVSDEVLRDYLPHFEEAMRAAAITTPRRAAAWCSQIGHESAGLRYMAEIQTSGPGWSVDRTRYRGRGPLQLTWSSNYRAFGTWCKARGYVTDADLFLDAPQLVEQPRWGFLSASWYWLNAGPRAGKINAFADAGNILNVSRCINGWVDTPNGMSDRTARWNRCLALGEALLPTGGFLMSLDDTKQSTVWRGAAQVDGGSLTVRKASAWLAKFLPKSFRDPEGVWVRDEIDALVNELVIDGFDLATPIDFGAGPVRLIDVADDQSLNAVTLLRIIGARQQAIRAQLNRIEAKLGGK